MIPQELASAAKILIAKLLEIRPETDAMNIAFMAAMDLPNVEEKLQAVRAIFPELLRLIDTTSELISDAFLSINWEEEGHSAEVFYGIMEGRGEMPDDLKELVTQFTEGLQVTEKVLEDRFGHNPIMSVIGSLGLADELENFIKERDEVQALSFAMSQVPDLPTIPKD